MIETIDQTGLAARTGEDSGPPLFEARNLSKSFGDVIANRSVTLAVRAGEIHALLGENGAGKSTFVKMVDGVIRPDSGEILLRGRPVTITSPADARRRGIGMVFQHFSTFDALTVAENIALTMPGTSLKAIRRGIRETAEAYGLSVDPGRRVETLSAGETQRVEIVRCLLQKPKLLILDEPTSVLTPQEAEALFETLGQLSSSGVAIIYISHRLEEVRAMCHAATILRRGEVVATCNPREETAGALAEMMIGETAAPITKGETFIGGPRLEVNDLSMPVSEGISLSKISFAARRGEVLGIAGVAGEGQSELFAALSGERRTPYHKAILIDGDPVGSRGPTVRRRLNAAFAPEQRVGHAAIGELPLSKNLQLTRHGLPGSSRSMNREAVSAIRDRYDVRGGEGDPRAGTLSGGNLQKFVIGRELERNPGIFVVEQPTWGIDAGAAMTLRNKLVELARHGSAVVVISQDLDEIFQICDRVAVIHRGRLSPTYAIDKMTPEKIGMLMTGSEPEEISEPDDEPASPVGTEQPDRMPLSPFPAKPEKPVPVKPAESKPQPVAPATVIRPAVPRPVAPATVVKPAPAQPVAEPVVEKPADPVFATTAATVSVPWTPPLSAMYVRSD